MHSKTNRLITTSDPNKSHVGATVSRADLHIWISSPELPIQPICPYMEIRDLHIGKKGALSQQSGWTTEPLSSGPPILQCHNNVASLLQHLGTKAGASTRAALTVCRAPLQMLEAKAGTLSLALVGQATLRACSSHFSGRDLELVPPPFGADGSHGTRYAPALLNIHKASAFLAKHSHAP